jgi:hypothetical protein
MWKVQHEELDGIPHRAFWRTIDRTQLDSGTTVTRKNPPAAYHMVLDGQQRVQSLLLALGGDDWGFQLEDRDWADEVSDRRSRGRQPKYRHWSKASLCFDLDAFLAQYTSAGALLSIDFRTVLTWAITDPTGGQSQWPKPDNYSEPLERTFASSSSASRLVRLSRLWSEAKANPNLKEKEFKTIGRAFLEQHGLSDEKIEPLLAPLAEFMTTLRDVKLSKVTYLELVPFDADLWSRDEYNDAIVNIFTRLNTAGRTLTREEITFAWLKANWNPALTGNLSAAECFEALRDELRARALDVGMDDVVNGVSFLWSVGFNDGKLLSNSDLLKGGVIRPMATDLSKSWAVVCEAVLEVTDTVRERDFLFGPAGQYASVNALAVLWSWFWLARRWRADHKLSIVQADSFDKKGREILLELVDRWILCSTWAGRWSPNSPVMPGYGRQLTDALLSIQNISDPEAVIDELRSRLEAMVRGLEVDAAAYVSNLAVTSRDRVSAYRNVLWVWHRLAADRWDNSRIPLRIGKKRPTLEVDHTLSHAYWEKRTTDELGAGSAAVDEAMSVVNLLGNCALLDKSFNISKSDRPLKDFIQEVHEFKEHQRDLNEWAQAVSIPPSLLDPETASIDEIAAAMKERDTAIRADVTAFVRGVAKRCDM